jgi:putative phage-type endonuclease
MTAVALATPHAELVAPADLPRDEWLAVRRRGIGSSDAAAVLGMDKWRGPAHVYLDKTGALPDEDEAGEAAYWGTVLEEPVARRFAEKTGLQIRPSRGVLRNIDRPWQMANLDREVADDAFLECKTTTAWLDDAWADDEIPDRVELQVAHQFAVTGYQRAFVAVLIGGQRFRWYEIERNEELIAHVNELEAAFWKRVQDLNPPPYDGLEQTTALLAKLWKVDAGAAAEIDPMAFHSLKAQRDEGHAMEKAGKELKSEADNQIKALLGANEIGLIGGEPVVTWKQQDRAGYTVAPTSFRKIHFPKSKVTSRG